MYIGDLLQQSSKHMATSMALMEKLLMKDNTPSNDRQVLQEFIAKGRLLGSALEMYAKQVGDQKALKIYDQGMAEALKCIEHVIYSNPKTPA